MLCLVSCLVCRGVVGTEIGFASQPDIALLAQVDLRRRGQTASIHWDQVPIGEAIARASNAFGEPAFIDRRVDRTQRVTLQVEGATFDELLESLASSLSLGASRVGELRYLGPPAAAEQLRTVAAVRGEEVATLPAALRASLERAGRLSWPRLTAPRALVAALAQQRGWRIAEGERIPHDLWPATSLPALSAAQQLSVLLIGFDLTFKANGGTRTLEIVPLAPVTLRHRYPLPARQRSQLDLLEDSLGNSVRVEGRSLVVEGRVEDHERVRALLSEGPRHLPAEQPMEPVQSTRQVYTLRVQEQPVGIVLRQLAERLHWTIEIDEGAIRAANLSLDTRVSFAMENSSQDELLKAVLKPAGLDYHREGDRIRIVPGEERE
jgi:hypothetical protein